MLLTKYYKYVNDEILTESHVKPDPPGYKDAMAPLNYRDKFSKISNDSQEKARKLAMEEMIKVLDAEIKGRLICMIDDNGRQRIIKANKISEARSGGDYFPLIVESDDKKIKYQWQSDSRCRIYMMDTFLEYFEEHFLDQLIAFQGKPVKGGQETRYIKHVTRIGIYGGMNQDNIIVESEDGSQLLLMQQHPIKILDMKLKNLDPYGEENWEE
jgi:hypothetical protein